MFPKHHHVNGNDLVHEPPAYALDGIRFILVILDVDD
jgi:hypothetical protein